MYGADSDPYSLTKASNSLKKFILLPSAKFETNTYISKLNEIILTYKIDCIIPTCEETFYLSKKEKELKCPVFAGGFQHLEVLHNKNSFIQLANNCGLPAPQTCELTNKAAEQYSQLVNGFVVKRKFSRFSDHVIFGKSTEDIPHTLFEDAHAWIIQEKLTGIQYCSYSIAKEGKVVLHSVYKAEYTAGEGASIHFQHESRADIENFVQFIVDKLHYTGQISFDFIVNESNQAIPIECNPRTTSGIHLFGKELVDYLLAKQNKVLYPKKETKFAISAAMLLYGYTNIKKTRDCKKWLKAFFTSPDTVFLMKDIKPFFYQYISLLHIWRDSRKNSVSVLTQSTYDICWDGEDF